MVRGTVPNIRPPSRPNVTSEHARNSSSPRRTSPVGSAAGSRALAEARAWLVSPTRYRSTDFGVGVSRVTSIVERSINSSTCGAISFCHRSDSYTAA